MKAALESPTIWARWDFCGGSPLLDQLERGKNRNFFQKNERFERFSTS
jgi:hypothetical protein